MVPSRYVGWTSRPTVSDPVRTVGRTRVAPALGYEAYGHRSRRPGGAALLRLARRVPACRGGSAGGPRRQPHEPRARDRDGRDRRGRRPDAGHRRRRRGRRLRRARPPARRRRALHRRLRGARLRRLRLRPGSRRHRPDRRLHERQARAHAPRAVDRRGRRPHHGRRGLRLRLRPGPGRGVVRHARGRRPAQRRPAAAGAARAPQARRAPGARRHRVGRSALAGRLQRRARPCDRPPARHRVDRRVDVPGGGDARGRHGDAVEVPCRGRRGGSARRPRERRPGRLHGHGRSAGAPLDLEPRSPVVAARTDRALAELATLPAV